MDKNSYTLSVIVPCYNEEKTLRSCIETVQKIESSIMNLEIIIINDASTDSSWEICKQLESRYTNTYAVQHESNQGKGAALRTGIKAATGEFVAIQYADLEYDPNDLLRLVQPLIDGRADVVLGSRFKSGNSSRVLYFWHSMGNKFLTLLSNMFTDLNLSDMETCYKVFKRDIIQSIKIEENRFGFEPEVVAKISEMRCRIYEMGISYYGRTYDEGKKIGVKDGFRALYCIIRYNAHKAPLPIQFFFYLFIGGTAALVNLTTFLVLRELSLTITQAAATAFLCAAVINYFLCINTIFRRRSYWSTVSEILAYVGVVVTAGVIDTAVTILMTHSGAIEWIAKLTATAIGLIVNFLGRRLFVFPEAPRGPWNPSLKST